MNRQFDNISEKSWTVTFLLCLSALICGMCGLHYFYIGKKKEGLIHLFTLSFFTFGLWRDIGRLWRNEFTDKDGKLIVRGN